MVWKILFLKNLTCDIKNRYKDSLRKVSEQIIYLSMQFKEV
jgi:hypothetical protein